MMVFPLGLGKSVRGNVKVGLTPRGKAIPRTRSPLRAQMLTTADQDGSSRVAVPGSRRKPDLISRTRRKSTSPETSLWGDVLTQVTPESILNRVTSNRQLSPSQKTVVPGLLGYVVFPTFDGAQHLVGQSLANERRLRLLSASRVGRREDQT